MFKRDSLSAKKNRNIWADYVKMELKYATQPTRSSFELRW